MLRGAADKTEKRTADQVIADLQNTGKQLKEVLDSPEVLLDPQKRQEIAPKAIPPMKKLVVLFDELASVEPTAKGQAMAAQRQLLAMLAVMGDADSITMLEKRSTGRESAQWKATLLLVLVAGEQGCRCAGENPRRPGSAGQGQQQG